MLGNTKRPRDFAPPRRFRAYQPKEYNIDTKLWHSENETQERIRSENLPNLVSLAEEEALLSRMHLAPPADACRFSDIADGGHDDIDDDGHESEEEEDCDQYDDVEEIVCSFDFSFSASFLFLFFKPFPFQFTRSHSFSVSLSFLIPLLYVSYFLGFICK